MIIHVSGSSGSGKTYIGAKFEKELYVVDIDDWTNEYREKYRGKKPTKKSFLKFIDSKIKSLKKKIPLILLVGFIDIFIDNKLVIYKLEAEHKYFIDIDIDKLFMQFNNRTIKYIINNKKHILKDLENNIYPYFKSRLQIENDFKFDKVEYVDKLKYTLMNQSDIIKNIKKIILNFKKDNI